MIGYKIAQVHNLSYKSGGLNDQDIRRVLVTLEIPDDAKTNLHRKDIVDSTKAKYRCNKAKVLKIEDNEGTEYQEATTLCYSDKKLKYVVGEEVEEKNYNTDIEVVCGEGIHFFLDKEVALLFGLDDLGPHGPIKDGVMREPLARYQCWWENGQKKLECHYQDGKKKWITSRLAFQRTKMGRMSLSRW